MQPGRPPIHCSLRGRIANPHGDRGLWSCTTGTPFLGPHLEIGASWDVDSRSISDRIQSLNGRRTRGSFGSRSPSAGFVAGSQELIKVTRIFRTRNTVETVFPNETATSYRWDMDPRVQGVVDHLRAAEDGLLTAADKQANKARLLEVHAFVWYALKLLSIAATADSGHPADKKV